MVRKRTKYRCILLAALLLICSFSNTTFAMERNTLVSVLEYENEMKDLFSQYGFDFSLKEYDNDIVITREELNASLQVAKDFLDTSYESTENNTMHSDENILPQIEDNGNINPMAMPISYSENIDLKVWTIPVLAHKGFRITLKGTVDAQRDTFISISSCTIKGYGTSQNIETWNLNSSSYSITGFNKQVVAKFNVHIVTAYTDPIVGMYNTLEKDYDISEIFSLY